MGALHEAHLQLIDRAKSCSDVTIMSIFVNPTQFGPKEDFNKYPRPLEQDIQRASQRGCDILFVPAAADIYPHGYRTYVNVEEITNVLCGASRSGHFRGVTTVVLKLFNIITPTIAVFGQKDAQQVLVLRRMVKDLHLPVQLVVAPVVRENDGLAMSSRNVFLTPQERSEAVEIRAGLRAAEYLFSSGERSGEILQNAVRNGIAQCAVLEVEYVACVDLDTLGELQSVQSSALLAVACRTVQSGTRLIDNTVLGATL
jgi:pantoate--beta-alanine ligase